jgi:hypothetical protein
MGTVVNIVRSAAFLPPMSREEFQHMKERCVPLENVSSNGMFVGLLVKVMPSERSQACTVSVHKSSMVLAKMADYVEAQWVFEFVRNLLGAPPIADAELVNIVARHPIKLDKDMVTKLYDHVVPRYSNARLNRGRRKRRGAGPTKKFVPTFAQPGEESVTIVVTRRQVLLVCKRDDAAVRERVLAFALAAIAEAATP